MGDLFGNGGSSGYPTSLDTATTQTDGSPTLSFGPTTAHASKANNLATAIINIETALGTNPTLGYSSVGLTGANNSGTPNTQYDFSANQVTLRRVSAGTGPTHVVLVNTGTKTNNISTAGPAANGRDQAGAFSANSWIHMYWIWDGTTLATLSSNTAPPTGPTLPTGYTHWAYICALRLDGSTTFLKTYLRGTITFYQASQAVLSGGSSATEVTIDASTFVPPNASFYILRVSNVFQDTSVPVTASVSIRLVTGVGYVGVNTIAQVVNQNDQNIENIFMPNIGQAYIYTYSVSSGTRSTTHLISAYANPNGAS